MGDPPRSIAQAQRDSEQDEKGRGEGWGQTTTQPPRLLPGRALTGADSPEKSTAVLEHKAQERSPHYALPCKSSRAQGRRFKNIKNSEQRTGFGFKTAVGAGMLTSFPQSGNSLQKAGPPTADTGNQAPRRREAFQARARGRVRRAR